MPGRASGSLLQKGIRKNPDAPGLPGRASGSLLQKGIQKNLRMLPACPGEIHVRVGPNVSKDLKSLVCRMALRSKREALPGKPGASRDSSGFLFLETSVRLSRASREHPEILVGFFCRGEREALPGKPGASRDSSGFLFVEANVRLSRASREHRDSCGFFYRSEREALPASREQPGRWRLAIVLQPTHAEYWRLR